MENSFITNNRNVDNFAFAAGHLKFRPQLMGYRGHPVICWSRISTAVSEKYSSWLPRIARTLQWQIVILRKPHNYGRKTFPPRCDSRTLNINSLSWTLKSFKVTYQAGPHNQKCPSLILFSPGAETLKRAK